MNWVGSSNTVCAEITKKRLESQLKTIKLHRIITKVRKVICFTHTNHFFDSREWYAVRNFITFFLFVRLCMKFNTIFAFIKLSFSKIILTSFNFANIRLSRILYKTLSRSLFKSRMRLKKGLP